MRYLAAISGILLLVAACGGGLDPDLRGEITATPTALGADQPPEATQPAAGTPTTCPAQEYTVQSGDTLLAIALSHGIELEALVAANDLPNPDVLDIGQVLAIPCPGAPAPIPEEPEDES
jgi:LysM repeat protein